MFVNLQLKTLFTERGLLMILSTFWSISWQSLKITKIYFLQRLDWNFVQRVLPKHVKNLILLLIADQKLWTFGLILKWRNVLVVGRKSNRMNVFFFMDFYVIWPSRWLHLPEREYLHHASSCYIWIHRVAGNVILRRFHDQELCQLKVYMLCSSQN